MLYKENGKNKIFHGFQEPTKDIKKGDLFFNLSKKDSPILKEYDGKEWHEKEGKNEIPYGYQEPFETNKSDLLNHEETLLKVAKELINNVSLSDIETIYLETTKYDDGSKALNIVINYPAEKKVETEYFIDNHKVE